MWPAIVTISAIVLIFCFPMLVDLLEELTLTSDNKKAVKESSLKKLVKENAILKKKLAELEQYRQNQELVLNWVDPRMKELDGPKE